MNENFNVRSYNEKDYEISMWSINKLQKDVITLNNIKLCDGMILLETRKEMENIVENRKLFIDEELISLQLTQIKNDNSIKRELNILITILITTCIKDIISEITLIEKDDIKNTVVNTFKCSNKIRYMIIMKIMYWLVNLCRKKDDKVNNTSISKSNTSTPKSKTKTNTSTPKTNTSIYLKLKLILVYLKLKLKLILVHLKLKLKLILVHLKLKLILVHLKLMIKLILKIIEANYIKQLTI